VKRALLVLLLLTGVYAMVLASFHPWDLLFGALVSAALIYAFRPFVLGNSRGRSDPLLNLLSRWAAFFPFAGAVLWEVIKGAWEVAVSALVTTLSPGAFLVEADDEVMLIHLIDASDPDTFRKDCEDLYQRYQRKVFP
jgi:multicomponent Na+:H+ antiporter subunit E